MTTFELFFSDTISLRNRHRPPDQQDALISSSDSEGEQKKNENGERSRVKSELANGNVDDMWAEVEEKNKDKEAAGSSSSEDNISLGSHADDIAETISSYRINRLPGRPTILEEHQLPENIEKVNNKNKDTPEPTNKGGLLNKEFVAPHDLEQPNKDIDIQSSEARETEFNQLMIALEKIHKEAESAVPEAEDENEEIDYTKLRKMDEEERKAKEASSELPELIAIQDSGSEDENAEELYKSCRALSDIANNVSKEETSEDIVKKSIDSMYDHYGSKIFAEHTESLKQILGADNPSFELDPKVCCDIPQRPERDEQEAQNELPKTREQQDYEEECDEANDRVECNMEELSSQLAEDLEELKEPLKKLREELDPLTVEGDDEDQKDKCVDMSTIARSIRLTEEFSMLRERVSEGMIKHKEEEDKKRMSIVEIGAKKQVETKTDDDIDAEDYAFAKALDICTEDVPTRVFGSGCDEPSYKWKKEECLRQLRVKEVYNDIPDDANQVQPLPLHTSAKQADEVCKRLTDKMAKEDASLRCLLQDLEDEANKLYDIESPTEEEKGADADPAQTTQKEEDQTEVLKKDESEHDIKQDETDMGIEIDKNLMEGPEHANVCVALLDELVDELQYKEIISGHDIKCYDFGPIESDEEYSYSAEPNVERIVPTELEDPAGGKSIRECVESFGDFIASVKERQKQKKVEKRESTSSEKVRAAQELLKSKTPFDFPTNQLDAEIVKQKEKTKRRIAAMASRCFEKRELYEDTLEVVDNRLMVVKKGTGALEELPPPPALVTDSESELDSNGESSGAEAYDTAEEAHEAVMDALSRPYTSRSLWAKPGQPLPAVQPNAPTPFIEQEQKPSLLDQALDEFYSLEAGTAFNSLDSEFMDKLDLQKVIGMDGEITDEGMRTYNEFQAQQKSELAKKEQSSELFKEDEMLKGLIERKRIHDERERQVKELDNLEDLTKFKINSGLDEEELPKGSNEESKSIEDVTENNYKDYIEQCKDLAPEEVSSDLNEIELESNEVGFELREVPNPDEISSIKLTMGTCKLYEIKSQLPEILEDIEEEDATGEKLSEEGNKEDGAKSNESIAETTDVTISAVQRNLNASIDDDILSDASTDYESSEEIPMIEPPKLPQGARNDFFCTEFEDGLKHDLECEEALRKELLSLHPGSWIAQVEANTKEKIDITEKIDPNKKEQLENKNNTESGAAGDTKDSNTQFTVEDDIDEVDGAIGELAVSAKEQWAKISKRLHDFIDADEIKLLDEREFKETSDNEDQLLVQDLEHLKQLKPIYEPECQSEDNSKIAENLESNLEIAKYPNGDQADIHDVVDVGEQLSCSENTKPPPRITLDYFDAEEPNDVDFGETGELKTEEIECNLEILNDDGNAVKNVSVNAQVTYEFK